MSNPPNNKPISNSSTILNLRQSLFAELPLEKLVARTQNAPANPESERIRTIYQLLKQGNKQGAIAELNKIANAPGFDSRTYLQTWYLLRSLGCKPHQEIERQARGVILEIHMPETLELIAVYDDHRAKYYSFKGGCSDLDRSMPTRIISFSPEQNWAGTSAAQVKGQIEELMLEAQDFAKIVGLWDKALPALPAPGMVRITMLTYGGYHFAEGSGDAMFHNEICMLVLKPGRTLKNTLLSLMPESSRSVNPVALTSSSPDRKSDIADERPVAASSNPPTKRNDQPGTENPDAVLAMRELLFADFPFANVAEMVKDAPPDSPLKPIGIAYQFLQNGNRAGAIANLKKAAAAPNLEERDYLVTWNLLSSLGEMPPGSLARQLKGVILEVHLPQGLELLAAYADYVERYYNYTGAGVLWQTPPDQIPPIASCPTLQEKNEVALSHMVNQFNEALFKAGQNLVDQLKAWDKPRLPPPSQGLVRINLLTYGGYYFVQDKYETLSGHPLCQPVIQSGSNLMRALTGLHLNRLGMMEEVRKIVGNN